MFFLRFISRPSSRSSFSISLVILGQFWWNGFEFGFENPTWQSGHSGLIFFVFISESLYLQHWCKKKTLSKTHNGTICTGYRNQQVRPSYILSINFYLWGISWLWGSVRCKLLFEKKEITLTIPVICKSCPNTIYTKTLRNCLFAPISRWFLKFNSYHVQ